MGSRSFTRALALALNEWLLMFLLFVNSVFSYMITKVADYSNLQSPCLMCSRLENILGKKIQLKKSHWDMICSKHKSEISSLVYCQAHEKLVDVCGICETCLKSNAETYRLLIGRLGSKSDSRYCSCCNQLWMPQTAAIQVAKQEMLPKIGNVRIGKKSTTPKKSVSFNDLPHVGYTELKFHSDTESEAVFSEDEGPKFRTMDLVIPPVITLCCDLATDKLLNLDLPLVTQNDQEELHLKDMGLRANFLYPEVIPVNGVPETSGMVLKEEEIISLDNLFLTSRSMEHFAAVSEKKEGLILLQDSSLPLDFKENPANAFSMVETELISLDNVTSTSDAAENPADVSMFTTNETFVEMSKENPADSSILETELISFNDVTSTSDAAETHEDISNGIDLMSLHDISLEEVPQSLTTIEASVEKSKENPAGSSSMEKTELISLSDDTSTSGAPETHEDVSKEIDLMSLHEITLDEVPRSLTTVETRVEENPADSFLMESELISLNDVSSTSVAAETHEDVSKGIDLMSLHDISLEEVSESLTTIETPVEKSKENPADSSLMEETELISLNGVTSASDDPETHEDFSKGIDLMSLHDNSVHEVPESLTTIETPIEKSKEEVTNQVDISCLESEDIVVSSSKSTESTPEKSTRNCVAEMAPLDVTCHIEAVLESDSSSFNSMSVAAETNQHSGELLDLADAYNIIVSNEGNKDSNGGEQIEQWMKKDTSRVSEDLKALLTQISASRGIEFLSPRDISPKISDQETKNLDYDMQLLLLQKLERNESNLSLEGVSVSEIEGESESDRLRRQVDHDRKLLTGLYKELEEERSASAIATNQAMAMITRLQEEKSMFQMEALQNLRMMEEQSEYDMEAIQKLNDLLVEREKLIQDLEAEIEYFRDQTPTEEEH